MSWSGDGTSKKRRLAVYGALLALVSIGVAVWRSQDPNAGPIVGTILTWVRWWTQVLQAWSRDSGWLAAAAYTGLAFACAIIDVPAPGLVAAIGAAVFGVPMAVLLSLPASTLGALVPFYFSRRYGGPWVNRRWPKAVGAIHNGLGAHGQLYLLSLRLWPLMPFALVNLAMGLTDLGGLAFFMMTLIGRLPATVLYALAGSRLGEIHHLGEILTRNEGFALAAVAVLPLLVLQILKRRRR